MSATAHVSWSTPVLRAEKTLRAIGEELETGTRARARALLAEHVGHIRDVIATLDAEERAAKARVGQS